MRRLIILVLLVAGMNLIAPLGDQGRGSEWLLALGFLILAAYSVGEIIAAFGIPKIVGYLLAGILSGPGGLEVVTRQASTGLAPVSTLAIGLIAFLAGAELRWDDLRERWRIILRILTAELAVAFLLITGLLVVLLPYVEAFSTDRTSTILAFSLLFSSVAIVHSPAVTMALLTETRAEGPVARTTLGVVLLADVVVMLLFSGTLALTRAIAPPNGTVAAGTDLASVVWEVGGAVIVGAVIGVVVALYLRLLHRELFFFAIMVALAGTVLADALHVETLLMLLVAGFVSENLSLPAHGADLRHAMERSAAPVFTVFFAISGTKIVPLEMAGVIGLAIPIVLARTLGIWTGSLLGARWAGVREQGPLIWKGLVSQAGVALGLAALLAQAYPGRGAALQAILVGVIALNEMVGPVLFRRALVQSGEIPAEPADSDRESEGVENGRGLSPGVPTTPWPLLSPPPGPPTDETRVEPRAP